MPTKSGIYYFYDENDVLLYIGKAENFRERMRKHMNEHEEYADYFKIIENLNEDTIAKLSDKDFDRYSWAESLYGGSKQAIDQELHQVKRIGFEEDSSESLRQKEKELILKFKPPFNKESDSEEYQFIQGRFWQIRNLFVHETRRRHSEYGL